ncbi:MAG: sensor histidine kinase N-terminal domain-containing protein [Limnobacter sp.]|nr:sensor histidine kinase N-terminal domain-containing protein [Limnobacter sp.]
MKSILNPTASKPEPSLRRQLLISIFLSLTVVMGIAGTISYKVSLHEADEIFGARLATSARVLESLLARQVETATIQSPIVIDLPHALLGMPTDEPTAIGHPYEAKLAFQLWSTDGVLLVRSETAPDQRLGPVREGFAESKVGGKEWHVFSTKSGNVWVEVAEEVGLRVEMAEEVAITLTSPLLIGILILLLVVNVTVVVGLRPLKELAEKISSREPQSTEPITLKKIPGELSPVIHALNSLFKRVSEAIARERRFTDAAAHELRTPLTVLNLHAQNLARATSEEDRAVSLGQLMQGLSRTRHLAEQMLTYSRISSNTHGDAASNIDLGEELKYMVDRQKMMLEGSPLSIDLNIKLHDAAFSVHAAKSLLEILLRNLLENACKYNVKPDQAVQVALSQQDANTCTLRVSNPSMAIPPEEMALLFEPYHRFAGHKQIGNGLGLAMVQEISKLYGWPVSLQMQMLQDQAVFVIEVVFRSS